MAIISNSIQVLTNLDFLILTTFKKVDLLVWDGPIS